MVLIGHCVNIFNYILNSPTLFSMPEAVLKTSAVLHRLSSISIQSLSNIRFRETIGNKVWILSGVQLVLQFKIFPCGCILGLQASENIEQYSTKKLHQCNM